MDITTKFNLNQKVWQICQQYKQEFHGCEACDASGVIYDKSGKSWKCPVCYGSRGKNVPLFMKWQILQTRTIGEIRFLLGNIEPDGCFSNIGHYKEGLEYTKIEYMAYKTGVGGGTLWEESFLFASEQEALKECERRNAI